VATMTKNGVGSRAALLNGTATVAPSKAAPSRTVEIPAMKLGTFDLRVVGTSPLLVHAWSKKARDQMLGKQMKQAKAAKEAKDPFADYCDSMYWLTPKPAKPTEDDIKKAKFGFPAIAFKAAAVDSCTFIDGVTKVEARGAFHINCELIQIEGKPVMDERMVRIAMGTADIRFRGRFDEWSCTLPITYNENALSIEQIINLFNVGGFGIGVGEHRPQRDGMLGRFKVEQKK
jgi:hypothetical protein